MTTAPKYDWKIVVADREIAQCPTLAWAQVVCRALNGIGHMPTDIRTHASMLAPGLTAEALATYEIERVA